MDSGRSDFAAGIILGAVLGAGLALLLAPRSGEQARERLREAGMEMTQRAREKAEDLRDRAREKVEEIRAQVREGRARTPGEDLLDEIEARAALYEDIEPEA